MSRRDRKSGRGRETARISVPPKPPAEETQSQLRAGGENLFLQRDRGTLVVIAGPHIGAVRRLDEDAETVVGRAEEATVRIDDPGLSRRHARIFAREGTFYVDDMDSKNGTYVEGEKIGAPRQLADGDRIQLGQNTLVRFSLQDALEQEAALQVYEWTLRDPLTGAYNRRYLDERLREELAYAQRHGAQLSLLMLDVDHFKTVNDSYGHRAGDLVLSALARFMQRALRTEDVAARFGGEEFVILVRNVGHDAAKILANRIRRSVQSLAIPWEDQRVSVTVSVGVATFRPNEGTEGEEELIAAADSALYRAKAAGRNCVSD